MFTRQTAVKHFTDALDVWGSASIALVGSAAIVFITGVHATEEDDRVTIPAVTKELRDLIAERGYAKAQAYKYLGLARGLVDHLEEHFPDLSGVLAEVLDARTPAKAGAVLSTYLEGAKVTSLDQLSAFLGNRYQRTPRAPAEPRAPVEPRNQPAPVGLREAVEKEIVRDPIAAFDEVLAAITDVATLVEMKQRIEDRIDELKPAESAPRRGRGRSPRPEIHQAPTA